MLAGFVQASQGQLPQMRLSDAQAAALRKELAHPDAALAALGCSPGALASSYYS